jgi:hypothetical protein
MLGLDNLLILLKKTCQSTILIIPIQHFAPIKIDPVDPSVWFVLEHLGYEFCQILRYALIKSLHFLSVGKVAFVVDTASFSDHFFHLIVAVKRKRELTVN